MKRWLRASRVVYLHPHVATSAFSSSSLFHNGWKLGPLIVFHFWNVIIVDFWRWNSFVTSSLRTACVWEAETAGDIWFCCYEGILQAIRVLSVQSHARRADVVNCSFSRLMSEWKQHVWRLWGGWWRLAVTYLSINTNASTHPRCPSAFPGLQGVCCVRLSAGVPGGVLPSTWFGTGRQVGV